MELWTYYHYKLQEFIRACDFVYCPSWKSNVRNLQQGRVCLVNQQVNFFGSGLWKSAILPGYQTVCIGFLWKVVIDLHIVHVIGNSHEILNANSFWWLLDVLSALQFLCTGLKPKTSQKPAQIKQHIIALENFHH